MYYSVGKLLAITYCVIASSLPVKTILITARRKKRFDCDMNIIQVLTLNTTNGSCNFVFKVMLL